MNIIGDHPGQQTSCGPSAQQKQQHGSNGRGDSALGSRPPLPVSACHSAGLKIHSRRVPTRLERGTPPAPAFPVTVSLADPLGRLG
ncbi:unnamed protein product [Arctogadus glacialis]